MKAPAPRPWRPDPNNCISACAHPFIQQWPSSPHYIEEECAYCGRLATWAVGTTPPNCLSCGAPPRKP